LYSNYPSPKYGNIIIVVPYKNGNYESNVYVGITSDTVKNDRLTEYLMRNSLTTWENADRFPNVFLMNVFKIYDKKLSDEIANLFEKGQLIPPRGSLAKLSIDDFSEENQKTILDIVNKLKSETSSNKGINMEQNSKLDLYYKSKGYHFPSNIISQFYASLKTKGFVILSGLSGTGKTKIALEFAELLKREEINLPQLLTAWGSEDSDEKFECAISWIKELISKNGYAILAWDDFDTIRNTPEPFILWIGKSGVRYGFIISRKYSKEEVLNNPTLKEKVKEGFRWSIELYDPLETELDRNKIFLEATKVIELNKKLSYDRFVKIESGEQLKVIPRKGYSKVKILDEVISTDTKSYIFLSVRPDWRDSKQLLGYYNPLDNRYYKTPLLELILRAINDYIENKKNARPYFIILDEMNLAHVEYYFVDFLSVLESGRDEKGFTRETIKLHNIDEVETHQKIPKEIKLPPNLYIIGTVNIDETTYMFSPKVLDRAFTIEFHDVNLDNYPPEEAEIPKEILLKFRDLIYDDLKRDGKFLSVLKEDLNNAIKDFPNEYKVILKTLNKTLEVYDLHFGYRVFDEICLFFKNAKESWENGIITFENEDDIFDLAMLMKILPKFHGNRKKLEKPLIEILKICLNDEEVINDLNLKIIIDILKNWENEKKRFRFQHTGKKILRMLRQLYEIGFASFS